MAAVNSIIYFIDYFSDTASEASVSNSECVSVPEAHADEAVTASETSSVNSMLEQKMSII